MGDALLDPFRSLVVQLGQEVPIPGVRRGDG